MKITVEIDVAWLGENGEMEDDAQAHILDTLQARIAEKVELGLTEKVVERLQVQMDALTIDMLRAWLSKPIVVSDRYGHEKEKGTIEEVLEKRFAEFWNAKVDKGGREVDSYSSGSTRLAWLIEERIKGHCTKFAEGLAAEVEKQVKAIMSDRLKAAVGGQLINALGVPEIIKRLESGAIGGAKG